MLMVLILDGNSENDAHVWRKITLFWRKKKKNLPTLYVNQSKNQIYSPGKYYKKIKEKASYRKRIY